MSLEKQIRLLVKDYKKDYKNTPLVVLQSRATTDVILLIEKNISVMQMRLDFNKSDFHRSYIIKMGLIRLKERKYKAIDYLLNI